MGWIKQFILILIFIFLSTPSYGELIKVRYRIKKGDSFGGILKKFVEPEFIIHKDLKIVQKIKKSNKHIKNWHHLKKGQILSLYFKDEDLKEKVLEKIMTENNRSFEEKLSRSIASSSTFEKKLDRFQGKTFFNIFYMASSGTYAQDVTDKKFPDLDLKQDSPVSVGGMFSHKFKPAYSFSFSGYFSKFDNALFLNKSHQVPSEYGFSSYFYYSGLPGIGLYGGLDYEKLSSFNLQNILNNAELEFDLHQFTYVTGGIDFFTNFFNRVFLFKFALSYSLLSKTTSSFVTEGKDFKGLRYLAYINLPISKNVFLHSLLKYHDLKDTETMSIFRIGVGAGYKF